MGMKLIMEGWRDFEREVDLLQERSVLKEKYPFKALYIVGPSGAGKTTTKNFLGVPRDFITSNTDDRVENVFPAFNIPMKYEEPPEEGGDEDMWIIQQNARAILQNADMGHSTNLVMKGAPLLFDTTGENVGKIMSRVWSLQELGYDVAIFQVNVPPAVSVKRDKERGDAGGRTVGPRVVRKISNAYQKNVVKDRGYFKATKKANKLAQGNNITVLGGDVFPNIYALADFGPFKKGDLTVSPQDAAAVGNPSFAETQATLERAKKQLAAWLGPVRNEKGQALLSGMKSLLALTDGQQGQNLAHIFATQGTRFAEDPDVARALNVLGGPSRPTDPKGDPKDKASGAIRKGKTPAMPTVRGLTRSLGGQYGMRTSPKK